MSHDDAVKIAPHMHSVIFENDKIRVLKVHVKPGDRAEMHSHPENMNYVLKGGKLRFIKPDGTHVDIELSNGQVTYSSGGSHIAENHSNDTVETVQVEFKE